MKLRLLALALAVCGGAAAQNPYIALQGANETADGIVVSQPRTVLAVDVTVEKDVTLSGPYARYAQKFLGVRAPLTDKTGWAVTGAAVALLDAKACLDAPAPAEPSRRVMTHAASDDEFARLQADKNDMTVLALEDAAREAANTIFSLRKHRLELITGEAGENVFGEGLKSALAEIERLEQSYLELFLGKRIVTTETRRYVVYPQADKKQYIVCRFSPAASLLPESDLSGDMVLLQIEPSGNTSNALEASAKETNVVACRVADPSVCTVIAGGREYAVRCCPSSSSAARSTSRFPAANNPVHGLHVAYGGAARRAAPRAERRRRRCDALLRCAVRSQLRREPADAAQTRARRDSRPRFRPLSLFAGGPRTAPCGAAYRPARIAYAR